MDKTDKNQQKDLSEGGSRDREEPLFTEKEVAEGGGEPQKEVDEMELLKEQVKQEQDKYFRALADMENFRKRTHKEKLDMTRFAIENTLVEFLSPLDNFENALSFARRSSEDIQTWAKGFEMILVQFRDVLANHQVTSFRSEGSTFDPHLHEVIEMEETEQHEEGTIMQEFIKGYKCNDRVLRPASVKVAKAITKNKEKKVSTENNQGDN